MNDARELGALTARMAAVESRVDKIDGKMDQVLEIVSGVKGGWRALAIVGAAVTTLGAGVATVVGLLKS